MIAQVSFYPDSNKLLLHIIITKSLQPIIQFWSNDFGHQSGHKSEEGLLERNNHECQAELV